MEGHEGPLSMKGEKDICDLGLHQAQSMGRWGRQTPSPFLLQETGHSE